MRPEADEVGRRAASSPDAADARPSAPPLAEDLPPEELVEAPPGAEQLAAAGLPGDTPLALGLGRPGPPDPVERGDAALRVRLFERDTGERRADEIVLWRIGAPANGFWTEGDQDVAGVEVGAEGCWIEGLAAGEYRIVVLGERALAPYAPPLFVAGHTEVELFVERPRLRPVRLVVETGGKSIPHARLEARIHGLVGHARRSELPPWVRRRAVQPEHDGDFVWTEESAASDEGELPWTVLPSTPEGYDAGLHPEDTRGTRFERRLELRLDGAPRADVLLRDTGESGEVLRFAIEL